MFIHRAICIDLETYTEGIISFCTLLFSIKLLDIIRGVYVLKSSLQFYTVIIIIVVVIIGFRYHAFFFNFVADCAINPYSQEINNNFGKDPTRNNL